MLDVWHQRALTHMVEVASTRPSQAQRESRVQYPLNLLHLLPHQCLGIYRSTFVAKKALFQQTTRRIQLVAI